MLDQTLSLLHQPYLRTVPHLPRALGSLLTVSHLLRALSSLLSVPHLPGALAMMMKLLVVELMLMLLLLLLKVLGRKKILGILCVVSSGERRTKK